MPKITYVNYMDDVIRHVVMDHMECQWQLNTSQLLTAMYCNTFNALCNFTMTDAFSNYCTANTQTYALLPAFNRLIQT